MSSRNGLVLPYVKGNMTAAERILVLIEHVGNAVIGSLDSGQRQQERHRVRGGQVNAW